MKIVLLLSGGVDSAVLLWQYLRDRREVVCLSVDYGQRHRRELDAARALAERAGVELVEARLPGLRDLFGDGNTQTGTVDTPMGLPPDHPAQAATVVPNRNMVLLSLAGSLAISRRCEVVAYGCHAGDAAVYRDCREEFGAALSMALSLADAWPVTLRAPFVHLTKTEIVRRGKRLGVPFELTYTCYLGGETPCGGCGACCERCSAFSEAAE